MSFISEKKLRKTILFRLWSSDRK